MHTNSHQHTKNTYDDDDEEEKEEANQKKKETFKPLRYRFICEWKKKKRVAHLSVNMVSNIFIVSHESTQTTIA